MGEIITAKNLCKKYILSIKTMKAGVPIEENSIIALDNINMSINEGEFIAIMGPSGSGKSTFLNLISTIDTPTKGTVYINGENVRKLSERKLAKLRYETIGFVFQEFNLIDSLKINENIAIPLNLAKVKKEEINERVLNVAKKLGIESLLEKYPSQCSGGQVQRVAIARALIAEPKIIVADEPTGNLDSKNSNDVMKIFKRLNEEEGITVLMVTHDSITASYADKVLNIKDGKIDKTIKRDKLSQREFFDNILKMSSERIIFD